MKLTPKRLQRGDTIGIVSPSSPPNQESLERSYAFLEQLGLKWKLGEHVKDVNGYLAGEDDDRLADIESMFADPEIDGIICAGGGYGSARYADRLDYQLISENPKIFWGFSDITFLHTAIAKYSGLVTFHGPMLASCVGKDTFSELSAKLFRQLFEPMELHYSEDISPLRSMSGGVVSGELTGGNLSLLASGIGTKFEIDTKGKILLIEDVGEEPYRVDNLMNQLRLAGKFADAAGIVIGDFADAEPKKKPSQSLETVLEFYTASLGKPVVSGFKIGHCEPHFAVPLGATARLDADGKTLTILPGVE
ncbi:S66 peptidase family protein [Sporosarcina trichiuri]|uniref:S66 peptidase family protein n=1 Tax=Sporosarcina trichiuri TaxID=3056445 RepID=UPI0025B41FC4|nr:LD-carboxypeptidase [Sporosarcina sp. 0.2-SM1T-5]WJY26945.1 LD-carboxypeptidase [Sporosarcina sp. 0.2-SM1T-5]